MVTHTGSRAYAAASVNPETQRGHDRLKIATDAAALGINGRFVGFYHIPDTFSQVSLALGGYASGRLVATVFTQGCSYGGNGEARGTRPLADGGMLLHCAAHVRGGPQDACIVYVAVVDLTEGTVISRRTTKIELGGGADVVIFDEEKCNLGSCLSPAQLNLLFSAVDKTTLTGNDDRRRITSVYLYDDDGIPTPQSPQPPNRPPLSIYLSIYLFTCLSTSIYLATPPLHLPT